MSAVAEAPVKSGKSGKTNKPVVNRWKRLSYFDLINEASKSIEDRRDLPIGRGERKTKVRRFHLLDDEVVALKEDAKNGAVFPNPHNKGSYFYIWEALVSLGVNKAHDFKDVFKEIKRQMSLAVTKDEKGKTAWDRYSSKPSRSKNGLDVHGKILQNIEVLQRVSPTSKSPYGYTVNQVAQDVMGLKGASIDILRDGEKGPTQVMLNLAPEEFMTITTRNGEKVRIAIPRNDRKVRRVKKVANVKIRVVKSDVDEKKPAKVKPRARKAKAEVAEVASEVAKLPEVKEVDIPESATKSQEKELVGASQE